MALAHATETMPPAAALATVTDELGPAHAAVLAQWSAIAEPNPLLWTAQCFADSREIRVRVVLRDRAPSPATIVAAVRLASPLLPVADRDTARTSLGDDLARWIDADRSALALMPASCFGVGRRWRGQGRSSRDRSTAEHRRMSSVSRCSPLCRCRR